MPIERFSIDELEAAGGRGVAPQDLRGTRPSLEYSGLGNNLARFRRRFGFRFGGKFLALRLLIPIGIGWFFAVVLRKRVNVHVDHAIR